MNECLPLGECGGHFGAPAEEGRGVHHEYGGPATDLGWSVAPAARAALEPAVARWQAAHG